MNRIILHKHLSREILVERITSALKMVENNKDIQLILSEDLTSIVEGEAAKNYIRGIALSIDLRLLTTQFRLKRKVTLDTAFDEDESLPICNNMRS